MIIPLHDDQLGVMLSKGINASYWVDVMEELEVSFAKQTLEHITSELIKTGLKIDRSNFSTIDAACTRGTFYHDGFWFDLKQENDFKNSVYISFDGGDIACISEMRVNQNLSQDKVDKEMYTLFYNLTKIQELEVKTVGIKFPPHPLSINEHNYFRLIVFPHGINKYSLHLLGFGEFGSKHDTILYFSRHELKDFLIGRVEDVEHLSCLKKMFDEKKTFEEIKAHYCSKDYNFSKEHRYVSQCCFNLK